jgi:hypothetical protein
VRTDVIADCAPDAEGSRPNTDTATAVKRLGLQRNSEPTQGTELEGLRGGLLVVTARAATRHDGALAWI